MQWFQLPTLLVVAIGLEVLVLTSGTARAQERDKEDAGAHSGKRIIVPDHLDDWQLSQRRRTFMTASALRSASPCVAAKSLLNLMVLMISLPNGEKACHRRSTSSIG